MIELEAGTDVEGYDVNPVPVSDNAFYPLVEEGYKGDKADVECGFYSCFDMG